MHGLGRHILAEFYGCDVARLNDPELLRRASLEAVERSGATIMSHHFKTFEPQGVSGVIVIAESHLAFHTWPEHGYAAIDYFTCGDRIDIHLAVDIMAEAMQPSRTERTLHWRGTELANEPHRPIEGEGLEVRAPEWSRISDHAADVEHWITEYHLDRRTQRRQLGFSYLTQEKVVRERGLLQDIAVARSPIYGRMLFIDGYLMTTELDEFVYHEMLAHVPLVLHPGPRRVLIVGGGDGGLLREVLRHGTVERVDLVEIDEQVIEVSRKHLPGHAVGFDDARVRLHIQDGARFVGQAEAASYDVALVDSTDPIGPARVLFEAPFFRALQRVLTPAGLLAAQSLSPWVQAAEQREMYGELGAVWPHVLAYHATVPTYPGGLWTFACCSNHAMDLTDFDRARARRVGQHCQYYTPELQVAAFHLPRFVQRCTVEIAQARRDHADAQPTDVVGPGGPGEHKPDPAPDPARDLARDPARDLARDPDHPLAR
jgi:spermidine synthase